jgi:hypothetical protein
MASLFCNATLSFTGLTCTNVKGFSVSRSCTPDYSAADLSNYITYCAAKNRIDLLSVQVLDARILTLKCGDTGTLSLVAKAAQGAGDLTFAGTATVISVEGSVQFAEVESPCTAVFAVVSSDGTNPGMGVT